MEQVTDPTRAELEAALKVCERATAGPWVHIESRYHAQSQSVQSAEVLKESDDLLARPLFTGWAWKPGGHRDARPNADFIALARTLLPKCIAALLERETDGSRELWEDVAGATPEMIDDRLRHVSVQIDRKVWDKVQAAYARQKAKEKP